MEAPGSLVSDHIKNWKSVNWLWTRGGRTKMNLRKYGVCIDTVLCEWREEQANSHLCQCTLCPPTCTVEIACYFTFSEPNVRVVPSTSYWNPSTSYGGHMSLFIEDEPPFEGLKMSLPLKNCHVQLWFKGKEPNGGDLGSWEEHSEHLNNRFHQALR